jgi:hypothetical protein
MACGGFLHESCATKKVGQLGACFGKAVVVDHGDEGAQ